VSVSRRYSAAPTVTGRVYHSTRPRGFAPWRPQAKTEALLEDVRAVLEEYAEHLPITGRQLFYRLVGRFEYPKDERSYERLLNALNLGRRSGLIPFESIRDDGATIVFVEHVMRAVMALADRVVVLNYGEVIAEGGPAEVMSRPAVVTAFLGKPFA
jgi:hypothetical protein